MHVAWKCIRWMIRAPATATEAVIISVEINVKTGTNLMVHFLCNMYVLVLM